MRRPVLISLFATVLCAASVSFAQRGGSGIELHGVPASVTSPGVNGVPRGIAGSVTDPGFSSSLRVRGSAASTHSRSSDGRGHHHQPAYAVPYYGYYALPYYDYSPSDQPEQPETAQPRTAEQQQQLPDNADDQDSRYGEHYFDARESRVESAPTQMAQATPAAQPDDTPATTLIYRDGHKSEVRNYAIVGNNLIDLTRSPVLKKIPLDSLDLDATRKQNEENGVDFHTP